jgi:hypothetical protein
LGLLFFIIIQGSSALLISNARQPSQVVSGISRNLEVPAQQLCACAENAMTMTVTLRKMFQAAKFLGSRWGKESYEENGSNGARMTRESLLYFITTRII